MPDSQVTLDQAFALGTKVGRVGAGMGIDPDFLVYVVREHWEEVVLAAQRGDAVVAEVLRSRVPAKFRADSERRADNEPHNLFDRLRSEMKSEQEAKETAQKRVSAAERLGVQ